LVIAIAAGSLIIMSLIDEPQAYTYGPIPAEASALRHAGATLGNGFSVAEGSALVGEVFTYPPGTTSNAPYGSAPIVDRGWRAVLLVVSDPRAVLRRYAAQAVAVGLGPEGLTLGCSDRTVYECYGGRSFTDDDPRSVSLALTRGSTEFGAVSHLLIDYHELSRPPAGRDSQSPRGEVDLSDVPPPVPKTWDPLAGVGESMFAGADVPYASSAPPPPLRVEPGSQLVAPVSFTSSLDWRAVLRVTGDPVAVARAYRRQLLDVQASSRQRGDHSVTVGEVQASESADGRELHSVGAESIGTWDYHIEIMHVVVGAREFLTADTTWMLVTAGGQ
jgi:hypothetical protein